MQRTQTCVSIVSPPPPPSSPGDCSHLWSAIFLLEYAKKSNPQISLLLMKLYGFLGATEFLTDLYDELYVKHVQIETLGFVSACARAGVCVCVCVCVRVCVCVCEGYLYFPVCRVS